MKLNIHRCRWYFHWFPEFQFGECDFGRFRGVIVDWLGMTFECGAEVRVKKET